MSAWRARRRICPRRRRWPSRCCLGSRARLIALLFRVRDAQRYRGDEQSPLVAVDRLKIKKIRGCRAQHSGPKKIDLTRLGREVNQTDYLGQSGEMRLPIGAEMALAGICCEREIRI